METNNGTHMQQFISQSNQDRLRQEFFDLLKRKPMTYTQLAEVIGIGRGTVSNFLNGKPAIYKTLALIENWLNK